MSEVFRQVLLLSLSGSLVALAVFLVVRVSRGRLSYAWHYYIWLVVLLRLLIPLGAPVSLPALIGLEEAGQELMYIEPVPLAAQPVNEMLLLENQEVFHLPDKEPGPVQPGGFFVLLSLVWAAVAACILGWNIIWHFRFLRFVRICPSPVRDAQILGVYEDLCITWQIKAPPLLVEKPEIHTPMLVGAWRPVILLPKGMSSSDITYILQHELVHYRRRDIWIRWLLLLSVSVHWFNPLVHWVAKQMSTTCELSCDEALLKQMPTDDERRSYGEMLLRCLRLSICRPTRILTLPLSEGGILMQARLRAILRFRRRERNEGVRAVMLGFCIIAIALFSGVPSVGARSGILELQIDSAYVLVRNSGMQEPYFKYDDQRFSVVVSEHGRSTTISVSCIGSAASPFIDEVELYLPFDRYERALVHTYNGSAYLPPVRTDLEILVRDGITGFTVPDYFNGSISVDAVNSGVSTRLHKDLDNYSFLIEEATPTGHANRRIPEVLLPPNASRRFTKGDERSKIALSLEDCNYAMSWYGEDVGLEEGEIMDVHHLGSKGFTSGDIVDYGVELRVYNENALLLSWQSSVQEGETRLSITAPDGTQRTFDMGTASGEEAVFLSPGTWHCESDGYIEQGSLTISATIIE